jgi:hypothetical protein
VGNNSGQECSVEMRFAKFEWMSWEIVVGCGRLFRPEICMRGDIYVQMMGLLISCLRKGLV